MVIRFMVAGVVGLGAVGACGDESFTLVIEVRGSPYLAVQDGDGPWQQLTPQGEAELRFDVTSGRYGLAYACESGLGTGGSGSVQFDTVPTDRQVVSCGGPVQSFLLTGTTAPGAEVVAGSESRLADPAGSYSHSLRAGVYDVIAVQRGLPDRILLVHDVELAADRTLDLPVATEGVEMAVVTPTVLGATGAVSIYSDLTTTADTYVWFGESATTAPVPPTSILRPGDRPAIGARDDSLGCTTQVPAGAANPTLRLPAAFAAQLDRTSVEWQADPAIAWEYTGLSLNSPFGPGPSISFGMGASADWVDATGAGDRFPVVDLSTLPGWPQGRAWFAPGQSLRWNLWTSRGEPSGDYNICGDDGMVTW